MAGGLQTASRPRTPIGVRVCVSKGLLKERDSAKPDDTRGTARRFETWRVALAEVAAQRVVREHRLGSFRVAVPQWAARRGQGLVSAGIAFRRANGSGRRIPAPDLRERKGRNGLRPR